MIEEKINLTTKETLEKEFEAIKNDLIAKHLDLRMKASGRWINSLEIISVQNNVKLLGEKYTDQLVYGRRGGTMPPVSAIEQWIKDKGIVSNIPTTSLAWAIAKKIQKDGTRYFQQGGTDLVSSVITEKRIQQIINKVGNEVLLDIVPFFINRFKNG